MNFLKKQLLSFKEFSKVKAIVMTATMTALATFAKMCAIYLLGNTVKIDFSMIPIAIAAMMYGPFAGAFAGGISDLLQLCVAPGSPIPGVTLSNVLCGVIFGLFLYKTQPTAVKIVIPTAICRLGINLFLTTFWISLAFGSPYFGSLVPKLIVNPIFCIVEVIILVILLPRLVPILKKYGF